MTKYKDTDKGNETANTDVQNCSLYGYYTFIGYVCKYLHATGIMAVWYIC